MRVFRSEAEIRSGSKPAVLPDTHPFVEQKSSRGVSCKSVVFNLNCHRSTATIQSERRRDGWCYVHVGKYDEPILISLAKPPGMETKL